MRISAFLVVTMLLGSPAFAENGKVVEKIERTSPNHTTIIYKDYRPKPAVQKAAPRPAPEVEFREYDLGSAPPPQPVYQQTQPAAASVPPQPVQVYSQEYSPGPNRGKSANGGSLAPGGAIFSNGFYGYGYGYYPYYPGYYPSRGRRHRHGHHHHVPGPGRVVGAPAGFQNLPAQRFAPPPPATSPYAYPAPGVRFSSPRCYR